MTVPLTKARRGALAILHGGPARYSNLTEITRDGRHVYWQSADWLIDQGFALRGDGETVEITVAGTERLRLENAGEFA